MNQTKKSCRGFSLLELLLAIAIIGLIILMATRYFTTVKASEQASAAIQEVQGIRSTIDTQLAQGMAPASVTLTSVCPSLPTTFCNGTTNLLFPWDTGTGSSTSTIKVPGTGGAFDITMDGIPSQATCNNILTAFNKDVVGTPACAASGSNYNLTLTFNQ